MKNSSSCNAIHDRLIDTDICTNHEICTYYNAMSECLQRATLLEFWWEQNEILSRLKLVKRNWPCLLSTNICCLGDGMSMRSPLICILHRSCDDIELYQWHESILLLNAYACVGGWGGGVGVGGSGGTSQPLLSKAHWRAVPVKASALCVLGTHTSPWYTLMEMIMKSPLLKPHFRH